MLTWLFVLATGALLPRAAADDEPELVVIVHPEVPATTLNRAMLASIFIMSRRNWEHGSAVVPFNYPPDSPLRRQFDLVVLGLKPEEVSRFWVDQRIRGQGYPPRQVSDPALMLRAVAKVKGSIGYLPAAMVDKSVRVIARIKKGTVTGP